MPETILGLAQMYHASLSVPCCAKDGFTPSCAKFATRHKNYFDFRHGANAMSELNIFARKSAGTTEEGLI